jgi:hypothetical protein
MPNRINDRGGRAWIWWATALLVMYPLSMGPAYWAVSRFGNGDAIPSYLAFYSPIIWACRRSTVLEKIVTRYGRLWWPGT